MTTAEAARARAYCAPRSSVQNITGGGACLKLANIFGLPETFDLTFEHGRTRRSCRVVWRTNDKLGVMFETSDAAAET